MKQVKSSRQTPFLLFDSFYVVDKLVQIYLFIFAFLSFITKILSILFYCLDDTLSLSMVTGGGCDNDDEPP